MKPRKTWRTCSNAGASWNCNNSGSRTCPGACNNSGRNRTIWRRNWPCTRQHLAGYEALLQEEQAIIAAYQALQQLREQEAAYGRQADEYAALNDKRTTLQHAVAAARQRLDIQLQNTEQRSAEIDAKRQTCEALVQEEPGIVQAYEALQAARRRDAEMARTMQQRYVREQEKGQVELSIQQKRHALELEQRSLLDRQAEYRQKEAALPTWQEQAERLHVQLADVERQALQLEEVRATDATLTFQLDQALPQQHKTLRAEIKDYEGKHLLLESAEAHCPLCETALTEQDRHRVMRKLKLEIEQREQANPRLARRARTIAGAAAGAAPDVKAAGRAHRTGQDAHTAACRRAGRPRRSHTRPRPLRRGPAVTAGH